MKYFKILSANSELIELHEISVRPFRHRGKLNVQVKRVRFLTMSSNPALDRSFHIPCFAWRFEVNSQLFVTVCQKLVGTLVNREITVSCLSAG